MNLIETRKIFRDTSGRYDLVNDDLSNCTEHGGGADFYINEAVQWLDRGININRSWGTHPIWVPQGTWVIQFPTARVVRQVRVDNARVCIISPLEIMGEINRLQGALASAMPSACCVMATAEIKPDDDAAPIPPEAYREVFRAMQIMSDTKEEVNTVVFNSRIPHDGAMVALNGMFYQMALIEDEDTNFWSLNHPGLLVNAAIRQTYVSSGNKALLDIINAEIEKDMALISKDRTQEAAYGAIQMRSNH